MSTTDLNGGEGLSPLKRAIIEIRALKQRVSELERGQRAPIALIGMGLRMPGGTTTPEAFWELLAGGVDTIGPIPAERWDVEGFYDTDREMPGKMYTRHGAFLDGIDQFAPQFFAIAPREAAQMDPQQRMLLQVAWEALEQAGQAPDRLDGSATGVFLGICNSDYFRMLAADQEQIDVYLATGSAASIAAGRISYLLGLHGPSIAIDTACSSSLVAVHLACQSLRNGECDLALAGGVNLIISPEINIAFSKAGMMAPDGRCKTFDAAADGYVRGEGCAVVVLKRLADALADGDQVLAVISGSAVNQDGRSGGLTAPSGPAQEAVIASALADAGRDPAEVSYVEAHGTGTALGDPIELQALGAVLGRGRSPERHALVGSLKTNVGHLEAAAGIAGLIKVALMLQHGQIAPHLHFNTPSPHIPWEQLPLRVPTTLTPWAGDGLRVAGVSSFGFSGTNAHIILEQAPLPEPRVVEVDRPLHLLTITARSEQALRELASRYTACLATAKHNLADVAFTANVGRAHFEHRLAVVVPDLPSLCARLTAFTEGITESVTLGRTAPGAATEVVFLFSGHGAHYAGMGQQLYAGQPVFRAAIDRCAALLVAELDRPLTAILFGDEGLLDRMVYAQPALFALQYALAELWQAWGVRPAVVAGHSAGEYVAAVVAGVLGLEQGLRLIAARGRLMETLPADGEMVAIFAEEARVAEAVAAHGDAVGIAAINGPETIVISGRRKAVQAVLERLALAPDDYRRLNVSVPAHSPLVEPILDQFEQAVAGSSLAQPQLGLVSSLSGEFVGDEITTARYWRRHLREPVRFAAVFETLRRSGYNTFVELGPHSTLLNLGQRIWPDANATWAPSLRRSTDEWAQLLSALATLYTAGVAVDWAAFDRPYARRKLSLPTYPWENGRFWSTAAPSGRRAKLEEPWPVVVASTQQQAAQGPFDLHVERYAERWQLLDNLANAYIGRAVRELGLFRQANEAHTVAEMIERQRIKPTYNHLFARWLGHLVDAGVLRREPDDRFVTDAPLAESPLDDLIAVAKNAFTGIEPLLDYVRRCGERLAAVVTGAESALNTLFPDGSYETVDYIYSQWAVARYFNGIARAALTAAAQARPGQRMRVLEIGAGTGGMTATLLPILPPERTSYSFTDVSDFFLARAAERFAAYPFVRYGLLNIELALAAQGYPSESFDVVVAANVLHATRDLDATLRHACELLAPGGILLLYETTSHPRWLDITTGLIEGWQRFEDDWRDDHPLLAATTWAAALQAAGFTEVLALPEHEQPTSIFGQHVIIARAPGQASDALPEAAQPDERIDAAISAARDSSDEQDGGLSPAELRAALATALPDERRDLLVELVRRSIGRVLRIKDYRSLRRDQPLLDLGFDSLMAVELRNLLRRGLELPQQLSATLVFDYPTISALAGHLEQFISGEALPSLQPTSLPTPPDTPATSAVDLAALSDAEVEAMLLKKLEAI